MGPGILFLPKAFSDGGIVFSSVGLLLVCVASTIGCLALLKCRQEHGGSYAQLAYGALGWPARVAVEFSLCTAQSGFCCVYLLFIAHNVRDVARHLLDCKTLPAYASIVSLVLLQLIVLVPLTWIRRLKRLHITNLLGEAFVLFGLFYIIGVDVQILTGGANSTKDLTHPVTVKLFNPNDWGIFLGTAAYAYEGVGLVIPIYESYRDDLKPQFMCLYASALVCMCLFITVFAVLTYLAFGDANLMSIVTLTLPAPNAFAPVHLVKILYSLALIFTYPLQLFPVIRITESKVFKKLNRGPVSLPRKWLKNVFRLFICACTAGVALAGNANFSNLVALIGSFCCVPLAFIYPPLIAFRTTRLGCCQKGALAVCLVFGLFTTSFCSYRAIATWGGTAEAQESVCNATGLAGNTSSVGGAFGVGMR